MKIHLPSLIIIAILLSACDKQPNFAELCEQYNDICTEFEEDTWCKKERINVGFANLKHLKQPIDLNAFGQLISYEEYAHCMERASQIEHIKLKEKKTKRINNLLKARAQIDEISMQTKHSSEPHLLYYHWSRYGNETALAKFLKMEGSGALESPTLQLYLATHYAKRDPHKTLGLLYHALELTKSEQEIDKDIFRSISSILADKGNHKQAYVWTRILNLYDPKDKTVSEKILSDYAITQTLDATFLDKVAQVTLTKIQSGEFKSPQKK